MKRDSDGQEKATAAAAIVAAVAATPKTEFSEVRKADALEMQTLELAMYRLVCFSVLHLSEEEEFEFKIRVDKYGPEKYIDFRWWLDYGEYCDDEDDYQKKFGGRTWFKQMLAEHAPSSDSDESGESDEFAKLTLWQKRIRMLKEHLAPEFRLTPDTTINASLNDISGSVTTRLMQ